MTNRMKNNTMKKIVAMMFAAMMIFSLAVSLAEADIWTCARCGKESRGNFCAWCGSSRPEEQAHCSVCGTEYDPEAGYAFCFNCGSSLHPDAVRTGHTAEPSVPADGESVRNEAARDAAANASSIQPGSTVFFGAYEQDSRRGNGTEPIEWIVLDVTDNQALLLSKYALDARQYNEWYFDNLTWRDSGMRAWLNGEFLNNSFTDAEKAALIMSFTGEGSLSTEDLLFLLNEQEAFGRYLTADADRVCVPTPYAAENAGRSHDDLVPCTWWLRTYIKDDIYISCVAWDGSSTTLSDVRTGMVRPACRVSTEFFGNGSALEGTWSLVDDPDTYYGMDFETTLEEGGSVTMTFDGSTMTLAASCNGEVYAQSFSYSTSGDMIILETGSCTYRISGDTLTLFFNGTSDDPYVMKKVY